MMFGWRSDASRLNSRASSRRLSLALDVAPPGDAGPGAASACATEGGRTRRRMAAGVNLLEPAVLADPYPTLHRLRREAPVHWDETHGVWMLSRYRDALAALRDVRVYSSEIHGGERTALDTTNWFVFHDAPRHARLRGLVTEAFTPS